MDLKDKIKARNPVVEYPRPKEIITSLENCDQDTPTDSLYIERVKNLIEEWKLLI
jgi:hypothetical protein